jgi:ATP-dependent Clp protease ATP-binding subunit ClpC
LKDEYISTEHIFLAILNERSTPAARLLEGAGVTRERVYEAVQQIRGGQRVTDPQAETRYRTLEKYSRDLTQLPAKASWTR